MRFYLPLVLVVLGCGGRTEPLMAQKVTLDVKGLFTDPNPFALPPGALTTADNVVIDRPGVIQPRRGFQDSGMSAASGNINTGTWYQDKAVFQYSASTLAYLSGTTKTDYAGVYTPPTGYKTQFAQANQNLYFTSSAGLQKLDAYSGTPLPAGVVKALQATASQTGLTGFQSANSQVAYRVVWGTKDANENFVYGAPSQRTVQSGFANPTATTSTGITRFSGTRVDVTTAATHAFVAGDVVYLDSNDPNFPSGAKTVLGAPAVGATTFSYTEVGTGTPTSTAAQNFYYATRNVSLTIAIPTNSCKSVAGSISRTGSTVTVTAAHNYAAGQVVKLIGGEANFLAGYKQIVTVSGSASFTYTESGSATTSSNDQIFASGITDSHFVQVFRTPGSASSVVDPGDEVGQVYEYAPTSIDLFNKSITFTDSTPDLVLGGPLYTNPSQEGILQANGVPPVSSSTAAFGGSLFLGNAAPFTQGVSLTLLATTDLLNAVVGFIFTDHAALASGSSFGMTASSSEASGQFKVFTTGTASQNIANTAKSFVKQLNAYGNNKRVFGYYASGPDDPPGRIRIETRNSAALSFYLELSKPSGGPPNGSVWSPALPEFLDTNSGTIARAANVVTVDITSGDTTKYSVGQTVYLSSNLVAEDPNFPNGAKVIASIPSTTQVTYREAGATVSGTAVPHFLSNISSTSVQTSSGQQKNALFFSKSYQPEAIPEGNFFLVGSKDRAILKLFPHRNSLWIFKDKDGLWRLTGRGPDTFDVEPFDLTVQLLSPELVATVHNRVYALTTKGLAEITEAGVRIVSGPITSTLQTLQATSLAAIKAYGFLAGYESDKKLIVALPSASTDTKATQEFIYHVETGVWTRWTKTMYFANVEPATDVLWASIGTTLSKERKTGFQLSEALSDQMDEGATVGINTIDASDPTNIIITLVPSVGGIVVGDALTQNGFSARVTQYLPTGGAGGAPAVTVDDPDPVADFTTASATIAHAIPIAVKWAPLTLGDPGELKRFSETSLLMDVSPDVKAMNVTFASDLSFSTETVAVSTPLGAEITVPQPLRTYVPLEKQLAGYLVVGFTHNTTLKYPQVLGFKVVAAPISERVSH